MTRLSKTRNSRSGPRRRKYLLRGYTLTEMLIVLVIIGLIASLIIPQTVGQMDRAKAKTAKLEIEHVAAALELFASDTHRYPSQAEGLAALTRKPGDLADWEGPYLKESQLNDPWGRPLQYTAPKDAAERPRVGTYGADGRPGGDGPNRDQFVD